MGERPRRSIDTVVARPRMWRWWPTCIGCSPCMHG